MNGIHMEEPKDLAEGLIEESAGASRHNVFLAPLPLIYFDQSRIQL